MHQPWASLIASGSKKYETRSWSTNYRGPIAIHAGMKIHKNCCKNFELDPDGLPLGAVVAIANLTDCVYMSEEFIAAQTDLERSTGCWEVGRFAWKLENIRVRRL